MTYITEEERQTILINAFNGVLDDDLPSLKFFDFTEIRFLEETKFKGLFVEGDNRITKNQTRKLIPEMVEYLNTIKNKRKAKKMRSIITGIIMFWCADFVEEMKPIFKI